MNEGRAFLEARDFLIAHRDDYAAAYAGFHWPSLERFNWALDYFDVYARVLGRRLHRFGLSRGVSFEPGWLYAVATCSASRTS
jgi:hypothetical protein